MLHYAMFGGGSWTPVTKSLDEILQELDVESDMFPTFRYVSPLSSNPNHNNQIIIQQYETHRLKVDEDNRKLWALLFEFNEYCEEVIWDATGQFKLGSKLMNISNSLDSCRITYYLNYNIFDNFVYIQFQMSRSMAHHCFKFTKDYTKSTEDIFNKIIEQISRN